MTQDKGKRVHPLVPELLDQVKKGEMTRREFVRTAALLGVSAGAAYAMVGARPRQAAAQTKKMGGHLRVGMNVMEITDPATFDWTQKGNGARQITEGLVRIGNDNVSRPYLAESWEASDDLKTWTFKLRKGVKWSNGDTFNADDLIFNVDRWLDPATGSSNQSRLSSMTTTVDTGKTDDKGKAITRTSKTEGSVERVDDYTVRLHLNVATLQMPESFGDYPALIVNRRYSDDGGDLSKNPVGTGPYRLVEHSVGEKIVLEKRPASEYWGDDHALDRITYIDLGDDSAATLAALASNQIDMNHQFGVELIDAIAKIPGLKLNEAATAATGVARMRTTEKPFDDQRVREAIRLTVDHQRLVDIVFAGHGLPSEDHAVAPIHPEYAKIPDVPRNIERAKQLIKDAGYENGLDVQINCVANPVWEQNSCNALAEMAKPAGINIKVNVMPGGSYWGQWLTWPFGFTSWGHRPLGIINLGLGYRTGGAWNESAHNNPEFDRLLDEAGGIANAKDRSVVMAKVEKILQDDSVISQSLWRSLFNANNEKVKGFELNVALEHHMNNVWMSA
ncbi:MAG: ABC transporter substrate-binding protein [Proteobacteria bacterium]|nr:ABC transporter substrate-binding protein [Pseudomonadota bacterium]